MLPALRAVDGWFAGARVGVRVYTAAALTRGLAGIVMYMQAGMAPLQVPLPVCVCVCVCLTVWAASGLPVCARGIRPTA